MLKEKAATISGIVRAIDLGLIGLSFGLGVVVCQSATRIEALTRLRSSNFLLPEVVSEQYALLILSLGAWIGVTQWRGSYQSHRTETRWRLLSGQFATHLLWVTVVGFLTFMFKLTFVSRMLFVTFLPISIVMLMTRQLSTRAFLEYVRQNGHNLRHVAVIGESNRTHEFSRILENEGGSDYRIMELPKDADHESHARIDLDLDEVFLTLGDAGKDLENTVLKFVKRGKRVHIVPGIFDGTLFRQTLSEFVGVPVLSIGGYGVDPVEAAAKRLFDLFGSIALLLALSPLLLFSALLIGISSRGPILFSQERLGEGGHVFRMLKFRTMHQNAEERLRADPELFRVYLNNNHKVPAALDPRIIKFGRFLRKTSLDELPQLLNVLTGHMSLVGPRPITPPQLEQYGEYAPLFLSAKPGITGYWQVQGRSEISNFSSRAALDIGYIRDQSLKVDVEILLRTIPAVLRRKGAH